MHGLLTEAAYFKTLFLRRMAHINLQLSYLCNFRCEICDFYKEPFTKLPRLSPEQVKCIVSKLSALGPQVISISGGEPLMHPDIIQITKTLAENNFPAMITNGWSVTPEKAHALFEAGLYEASVSLDYIDPANHDRQRGRSGAWEKAAAALKILHEQRTEPHQRVHMISVVMDDNLADIEPLIQLAGEIGVTYLVTLYSSARGRKAIKQFDTDLSSHLLYLHKKYPQFVALRGYISRFTEASINDNGILPCYAGKNLMNIGSTGSVSRCIDTLDTPAGNIFTDELDAILKRLEEQFKAGRCGGCWTSCRGSIETLMYDWSFRNLADMRTMTKPIPIDKSERGKIDHA